MEVFVDVPFDCSPILPRHVKATLKRCSSNSKPCVNGISYFHLQRPPCTHLLLALLYSTVILHSHIAPPPWCISKITLIHKYGPTSDPGNFWPIALTSTIGKIYHNILASCPESYRNRTSPLPCPPKKASSQAWSELWSIWPPWLLLLRIPGACSVPYTLPLLISPMPSVQLATNSSTTCWPTYNCHLRSSSTWVTCTLSSKRLYLPLTVTLTSLHFNSESFRATPSHPSFAPLLWPSDQAG